MGPLFPGLGNGQPIGLGLSHTPPNRRRPSSACAAGQGLTRGANAPLVLDAPGWAVLCLSAPWQVRCLFAPPPKGSVGMWPWCRLVPDAGSRLRSARSASAVCCASSGPSGISLPPAGIGAGHLWGCQKQLRSSWSRRWLITITRVPLGAGSSVLNPGPGLLCPFGAGRPIWQKRSAAVAGPCRPWSWRS